MNVQDRVNRLSALLGRIKHNVARPRVPSAGIPLGKARQVPTAAPAEMESVDELLATPEPYAPERYVAPAVYKPESFFPEEEPIPLVAASTETAEISEPVAEEIFEEDIIELAAPEAIEEVEEYQTVEEYESMPPPAEAGLEYEEQQEEPLPASSRRERLIPGSMDEALASAAQHLEDGREVPLKTPPPESGPQQAALPMPPGLYAPPPPNVDDLLRAETPAGTYGVRPTPEQLGQTIDLEEGGPSSLELEEPRASQVQVHARGRDELEAPLPSRETVRQRTERVLQPPEPLSEAPYSQRGTAFTRPLEPQVTTESPVEAVSTVTVEQADFSAPSDVVARPALAPAAAARFAAVAEFRPSTFVELLDASLSLGSE